METTLVVSTLSPILFRQLSTLEVKFSFITFLFGFTLLPCNFLLCLPQGIFMSLSQAVGQWAVGLFQCPGSKSGECSVFGHHHVTRHFTSFLRLQFQQSLQH